MAIELSCVEMAQEVCTWVQGSRVTAAHVLGCGGIMGHGAESVRMELHSDLFS